MKDIPISEVTDKIMFDKAEILKDENGPESLVLSSSKLTILGIFVYEVYKNNRARLKTT